ncbi:MAG: MerR family transcriptional regulator [Crocinitomix sp.]|nr:MerR family transcriptional regulator [Crocinitomix sp.]
MSEVDMKLQKLYYSMGEVSEMFSVNASLIRFWEKEFSIIKPKKNKKGNRLFTQKDIKNFQLIYQLVKIEGYTLEGAKQRLRKGNKSQNEPNQGNVVSMLEQIKKELLLMQDDL